MKFKFIASGITFDTGVNKEEVEYNVQQAIGLIMRKSMITRFD